MGSHRHRRCEAMIKTRQVDEAVWMARRGENVVLLVRPGDESEALRRLETHHRVVMCSAGVRFIASFHPPRLGTLRVKVAR